MTALLRQLDQMRESGLLAQIIRFGIAGVASSLIYSAVYLPLTFWVFPREHAVYAVPFAFAVAVTCGFYMHSKWSFKDHGTRTRGGGQQAKFVAVQATGMLLNGIVTWIGTALLGFPAWAPLVPAILLATVVTFLLNRYLVFA